MSRREGWVHRHRTLPGFIDEADRRGALDLRCLEPLTQLSVRTRNTLYRVTLVDPSKSKVLIQGGRFSGGPVEACLQGSSFGGSMLKAHWICLGMQMEIAGPKGNILTSPVSSVVVEPDPVLPGPF